MNDGEHLLICLSEECAEVQKAIAKALRFGLDDGQPGADTNNAQDIARECLDVIAIIELLEEAGIIEKTGTIQAIEQKKAKVQRYMEYAAGRGTITPHNRLGGYNSQAIDKILSALSKHDCPSNSGLKNTTDCETTTCRVCWQQALRQDPEDGG